MENALITQQPIIKIDQAHPKRSSTSSLQPSKQSSCCEKHQQRSCLLEVNSPLYNKLLKQAKLYSRAERKILGQKGVKILENRFEMLLDLIRGYAKVNKFLYNHKNQLAFQKQKVTSVKYGRFLKKDYPKIIVLTPQIYQNSKEDPALELLVISFSGKIEFQRFFIKFEDLSKCLVQMTRQFKNSFLVAEKVNQILEIFGKTAKELQNLLCDFQMLHFCLPKINFYAKDVQFFRQISKKTEMGSQEIKLDAFQDRVTRFFFVKQALTKNMLNLQPKNKNLNYIKVLPYTYNIVSSLIQVDRGSYSQQIELYLPDLQLLFARLTKDQRKINENRQSDSRSHYPDILYNSHSCWVCKKRTLIGCTTCSVNQAKDVGLCIQCYTPYHQSIKVNQQKVQISNTLSKWERIEENVDVLMLPECYFSVFQQIYPLKMQENQ